MKNRHQVKVLALGAILDINVLIHEIIIHTSLFVLPACLFVIPACPESNIIFLLDSRRARLRRNCGNDEVSGVLTLNINTVKHYNQDRLAVYI